MKSYDVIVIGSGGGLSIAANVAEMGCKVALIENSKLGGTCLNRGCIPSKMLIHPANIAASIKESKKLNINAKFQSVDFKKLLQRINKKTDKDSNGMRDYYKTSKNPKFYSSKAKFVSDKVIEVNGEKITGKKIFIATGAHPFIPPIPGLKGTPFMTSTEALRARNLPKKLLVIGGGYIACELGHAYGALGSEVNLLVRGDRLLMREDSGASKEFTKEFAKQYNVHFNTNTEKVEYKNGTFTLSIKNNKSNKTTKISGDALLVATGVKPGSELVQGTNIQTNKRGFIKVNKFLETTVKDVYALGDVVGNYMFRHSVNFESSYLFNNVFRSKVRKPIKYPPMPHAVFTHPEIGSVGMTEEQLQEKKISYVVGMNTYEASAMGMARLSEVGFVKLLFHRGNRKLLGAHILGEEASTMIHQLIYAITFGATVDDLNKMIYIHPALPEIVSRAAGNARF